MRSVRLGRRSHARSGSGWPPALGSARTIDRRAAGSLCAVGRVRQQPAKLAWRHAGDLLEAPREVKLIAEAQAGRDRAHGWAGLLKHSAGGVDPPNSTVARRRDADMLLEAFAKCFIRNANRAGDGPQVDILCELGLQQRACAR